MPQCIAALLRSLELYNNGPADAISSVTALGSRAIAYVYRSALVGKRRRQIHFYIMSSLIS